MEEFKNHPEFLVILDLTKQYNLWYGLRYQGTERLYYELWYNGKKLFEGNDYRPSPLHNIDDLESVIGGLSFLTLQEGAVDSDYFKNYTPEQIEFRDSLGCESLNMLLNDCETYLSGNDEYAMDCVDSADILQKALVY